MKSTLEGLDRISEDPENLPPTDQYIQVYIQNIGQHYSADNMQIKQKSERAKAFPAISVYCKGLKAQDFGKLFFTCKRLIYKLKLNLH